MVATELCSFAGLRMYEYLAMVKALLFNLIQLGFLENFTANT
jgi:hypothetical protein